MVGQYGEASGPVRVKRLPGNAPVGRPFAGGREVDEEKILPVLAAKEAQVVPNLVLLVTGVRFVSIASAYRERLSAIERRYRCGDRP